MEDIVFLFCQMLEMGSNPKESAWVVKKKVMQLYVIGWETFVVAVSVHAFIPNQYGFTT